MTCSGVSSAGPLSLNTRLTPYSCRFFPPGALVNILKICISVSLYLCPTVPGLGLKQVFWQTEKVGRPKVAPLQPLSVLQTIFPSELRKEDGRREEDLAVNIVATLYFI